MRKEDIHLNDIARILLGEAPTSFLLEVFVRTVFIYLMLLVVVRLMGKRMNGQLTIAEMAVMLMLGAIVSPAMQIPNVGLFQGVAILVIVLGFQRGLNWLEFKYTRLENINHGKVAMLIRDGQLILPELEKAKMSRQQLFAVLRNASIFNLGDVERVYLESFGMFSVYRFARPRLGLSILPPGEHVQAQHERKDSQEHCACISCGHVEENRTNGDVCPVCETNQWSRATLSI